MDSQVDPALSTGYERQTPCGTPQVEPRALIAAGKINEKAERMPKGVEWTSVWDRGTWRRMWNPARGSTQGMAVFYESTRLKVWNGQREELLRLVIE